MTLETILRTVLHAAAGSAFFAFCGVVATVGVCSMLRLLCHALAETGRTCGKFVAMMLASVALVCAVVGGGKALNGPPDGVSAPARVMSTARGAPETCLSSLAKAQRSAIAPETCLRGPANAPETLPPHLAALGTAANAQDVPRWELRGAHDDAIRIPAVGWDFRTPDGFVEGMTVLSRGELRPKVGRPYFPRPFTNDLSLLPRSRWGLLPGGGESRLWYAATPSNSLLVTWVNGLVDRNPLTPTNFQAEFFPDGSYEYRYPDHCELHPFVLPFDLDGDGLENTVDPAPLSAGPDAHNTNAEWYNVVCSNVLSAVEGDSFTWRSGVNSNAYYFVEVIVPRGPAPVYFVADGPSDLGNPVIVATAGATSRVPLLIGATYAVTSDTPFTVSVPDASDIAILPTGATSCQVKWPIMFEDTVTEVDGHSVHAFTPSFDLGGTFNWSVTSGGTSSDQGPSLMSGAPSVGCGFTSTGNQAWFACAQENCGCGGCTADGTYDYEGYRCAASSFSCGCHHEEYPDSPPDPLAAGFSVWTDRQAVIFEERYQNAPGQWVERRSTDVRIVLSASGGEHGGRLTLTTRNLDRLVPVSSGPFLIPSTVDLATREPWSLSFTCKGVTTSAEENDVEIEGVFTENETGRTIDDHAKLTVIRVEVVPKKTAYENACTNRHKLGLCEVVKLIHHPAESTVTWQILANGFNTPVHVSAECDELELPRKLSHFSCIEAACHGAKYYPEVSLVEPSGVICTAWEWNEMTKGWGNERKNTAGYVGMYLTLKVTPRDVSFEGIDFAEEPSDVETHTEYFSFLEETDFISHTTGAGAGIWHHVAAENYFCRDEAVTRNCPPPWLDESEHVWEIPHVWRRHEEITGIWMLGEMTDGRVAVNCRQVFSLNAQGTASVWKHGRTVSRTTNNCVRVEGAVVYGRD